MKKKNVYFIFTIEENDKLYSIEIESINIQEPSNTILYQEKTLSVKEKTFFIILIQITFECSNIEDITFKLKLNFEGKTFFSQELQIPKKNNSKFIYTYSFNRNEYLFK